MPFTMQHPVQLVLQLVLTININNIPPLILKKSVKIESNRNYIYIKEKQLDGFINTN